MARIWRRGLAAAGAATLLVAVYVIAANTARDEQISQARATAHLYVQSLRAEIDRRRHIPEILSTDDDLAAVASGANRSELNARLEDLALATESEAIYLMDRSGLTVAASNWRQPDTYLDQNYRFRSYFEAALGGEVGRVFAIGATTGRPGAFVSHPVKNAAGAIIAVLAVKIDFDPLFEAWAASEHDVLLINSDGIVLIAGRKEWRYRATRPLSDTTRDAIDRRRQFADQPLSGLDVADLGDAAVKIDDRVYLRGVAPVGWLGWELWLLRSGALYQRDAVAAVAIASVGILLVFAAFMFMRSERIRSALLVSQRERSELSGLNRALNREIEERRAAEAELRQAQTELQRSAKLAALGQLSASVTHELGQPLSAMKTYVRTAQRELAKGGAASGATMDRLDRLVDRMSAIAQQLKFFARRSGEPVARLDIRDALAGAIETLEPALEEAGVTLVQHLPDQPVQASGGRNRLEQVFVNLLRNAMDAMRESDAPVIELELTSADDEARIAVRDVGEGISADLAGSLFEPFATTRASGEGMGLGLAISASIVQEHGGTVRAGNRAEGGAEFVVTLPLAERPEQAGKEAI